MTDGQDLLGRITKFFMPNSDILAITVGGSRASREFDFQSDMDLYVYSEALVSIKSREELARQFGSNVEVGNKFWEDGDEWIDRKTNLHVDIMYRSLEWAWKELNAVINEHAAKVGYTTAVWHNIINSEIIYEQDDCFRRLKCFASAIYPDALQSAIIKKNAPLLRSNQSSYLNQIRKAIHRGDSVSLVNRLSAFQDSYFDVLFAINKATHPGEKRLIDHSEKLRLRPRNLRKTMSELFLSISKEGGELEICINRLCEDIFDLLKDEGVAADVM